MRRSNLLRGFLLASASVFSLALTACATTGGQVAKETVCQNKARIIAAANATIEATEMLCPFNLDTESETDAINP